MDTWNLIVCNERWSKQGMVMQALRRGMPPATIRVNDGPVDRPFVCAGQLWAVERMVPKAHALGTKFWMIDNGYYRQSGKGRYETGHWEFTYRGLEPIILDDPDYTRLPYEEHVLPWQYDPDGDVLIGIPGVTFGKVFGYNVRAWCDTIEAEVRKHTKKKIRTRTKWSDVTIEEDLKGVSVLVTHSSHVAIDALRLGIPAIVAPTSPAAAVCSHSLADIDNPLMPDRRQWWASLMCQQFTLEEMKKGTAWDWMNRIMEQVDGRDGYQGHGLHTA